MAKQQMLPQLSAKQEAKQRFETELTQKEQQARRTFERQQRFPPSKRLVGTRAGAEYRRQRESEFETLLGEWKTEERAKFETRLQEWEPEASSPEMIRFYGLPSSREQAYPTKQQGGQGLLYVRQPIFRVYGRIARSREAKAGQAEQSRSYQSWLRISRTRSYFMERGLEREAEEKGELAVTIPQVDPALVRRFSGKMMELEEKKQLFRVYEPAETVFEGIETPLSSVVRGVTAQTKHYPGEQYLVVPYSSEMAYAMLQGVMPQVKKTGEGYEFSVKPVEEPKGIAETLASFTVVPLMTQLGFGPTKITSEGFFLRGVKYGTAGRELYTTRPLAGYGGIIASFEAPIYSVARLGGLETPRIPPTLIGGLIGQPFGSTELERAASYGSEYMQGAILGDFLLSYALLGATKGVEKIGKAVYVKSGLKYSHTLYRAKEISLAIQSKLPSTPTWLSHTRYVLHEAKSKLPSIPFKGSKAEAWLIKHSPWYRERAIKGITPMFVSTPTPEQVTAKGIESIFTPESLRAFQTSILLENAPRTTAIAIAKTPTIGVASRNLPVYFGLGKELIQFIPETQLAFTGGKPAKTFPYESIEKVGSFEKIGWQMGGEGELWFVKERLPTTKQLLETIGEETTKKFSAPMKPMPLVQIMEVGYAPATLTIFAKQTHILTPVTSSLAEATTRGALNLATLLGATTLVQQATKSKAENVLLGWTGEAYPFMKTVTYAKTKAKEKTYPASMLGEIQASFTASYPIQKERAGVGVASDVGASLRVTPLQAPILMPIQMQRASLTQSLALAQLSQQVTVMDIPTKTMRLLVPSLPQFPEEAKRKRKRKKRKGETVAFGLVTLEWPVASVEEFLGVM